MPNIEQEQFVLKLMDAWKHGRFGEDMVYVLAVMAAERDEILKTQK